MSNQVTGEAKIKFILQENITFFPDFAQIQLKVLISLLCPVIFLDKIKSTHLSQQQSISHPQRRLMKYLLPLETIHQITSCSISVFVFYARTKELRDELRVVLLTPGRDNVAFRNRFVM